MRTLTLLTFLAACALMVGACGAPAAAPPPAQQSAPAGDDAMTEEAMTEEAMADEAMSDAIRYVKELFQRDGLEPPSEVVKHGRLADIFVMNNRFGDD